MARSPAEHHLSQHTGKGMVWSDSRSATHLRQLTYDARGTGRSLSWTPRETAIRTALPHRLLTQKGAQEFGASFPAGWTGSRGWGNLPECTRRTRPGSPGGLR